MLTWGDGVSDVDLDALLAFHRSHGKLATMTAVRPPARFGHLELDGDRISEFSEKPQTGEGWINGAFFVLEPGVFDYIDGDDTQWEKEPLERLAKDGQLMAYRHDGFWQCMDTIRDKKLLEQLWDAGDAPWKSVELSDEGPGHRPRRLHRLRAGPAAAQQAGHEVVGLDSYLFEGCTLGADVAGRSTSLRMDIRDVRPEHLEGIDAVVHLAGISNDPLGDLRPETTYEINHLGAVRVARGGQGGRRRALRLLVVVQPLRRPRRRPDRRVGGVPARSRPTASRRSWPSAT